MLGDDEMNQLVFQNKEQIVTSSRNVARDFGKRHDHVTRDIDEILRGLPKNEDTQQMFCETTYIHEQNKQQYREYLMNRDGFTLLVMGFTGRKAMQFKMQYMKAFNEMEKQLKELNQPSYMIDDPIERAQRWIVEQTEKKELQTENAIYKQQIAEYEPKITYIDEILKSNDAILVSQIAEDYGMSARQFNKLLKEHGIQYKMSGQWLLYSKYKGNGYTKSETTQFNRTDGRSGVSILTKWTQKGRLFLYEFLKSKDILPTMEQMKMEFYLEEKERSKN